MIVWAIVVGILGLFVLKEWLIEHKAKRKDKPRMTHRQRYNAQVPKPEEQDDELSIMTWSDRR